MPYRRCRYSTGFGLECRQRVPFFGYAADPVDSCLLRFQYIARIAAIFFPVQFSTSRYNSLHRTVRMRETNRLSMSSADVCKGLPHRIAANPACHYASALMDVAQREAGDAMRPSGFADSPMRRAHCAGPYWAMVTTIGCRCRCTYCDPAAAGHDLKPQRPKPRAYAVQPDDSMDPGFLKRAALRRPYDRAQSSSCFGPYAAVSFDCTCAGAGS